MKQQSNKPQLGGPSATGRFAFLSNIKNAKSASMILLAVVFVIGSAVLLFQNDQNKNAKVVEDPKPLSVDMPGWWFKDYFGSSVCEVDACKTDSDPDGDGLDNGEEFYYGSNPTSPDTNGNGKNDGEDVALGIEPKIKGDLTFEQAQSDENIFGESLLFSDDVKTEFIKSINPENAKIPEIADSELTINENPTTEDIVNYVYDTEKITSRYFTSNQQDYIANAIASNNQERLLDIQLRSSKVAQELRDVTVPREAVTLHKYTIVAFQLLQVVVVPPSEEALQNDFDPVANRWYDNVQSLMVLMQKMGQEYETLQNKYAN